MYTVQGGRISFTYHSPASASIFATSARRASISAILQRIRSKIFAIECDVTKIQAGL